jgi:hypothetical protein
MLRLHSVYDGTSDPVDSAFRDPAHRYRLPANRIRSKVNKIVRCIPRNFTRRPPPLEVHRDIPSA